MKKMELATSWDDMEDDTFDVRLPSAESPVPSTALPDLRAVFMIKCPKCAGSGRWGYTHRTCFACNGKGQQARKTDPAVLARAKVSRVQRLNDTVTAWKRDNAAVWTWMVQNRTSFEFAGSLADQVEAKGYLSEKQLAAAERCTVREQEHARAQAELRGREAAAAPVAPTAGVTALEECFARAKAKGTQRPKMGLASFRFSLAPAGGVNAGAIYVKDRSQAGTYLGKVMHGRLFLRGDAKHLEAEVLKVLEDPQSAAIAYGKEFGVCAICNRDLSDPESVARGIGPVCANSYF